MQNFLVNGLNVATQKQLELLFERVKARSGHDIKFVPPKRGEKSMTDIMTANGHSLAVGTRREIEYYLVGYMQGGEPADNAPFHNMTLSVEDLAEFVDTKKLSATDLDQISRRFQDALIENGYWDILKEVLSEFE